MNSRAGSGHQKSGKLSTARGELATRSAKVPSNQGVDPTRHYRQVPEHVRSDAHRVRLADHRAHPCRITRSQRARDGARHLLQTQSAANPARQSGEHFDDLFIPAPGNVLIVADYASMEMRAAAYVSGEPAMTRAFEEGQDLHSITAARMLGITPDQVSKARTESRETREFRRDLWHGRADVGRVGVARIISLFWTVYEAERWLQPSLRLIRSSPLARREL